jgi:TM2 domain-containing membrane protein YozV
MEKDENMSEKNPFYAYFISIILPGLGQIYLNHKKRGLTILIGALALSITLAFLIAFPLYWIIMASYWIWQVFDTFFLYKSENSLSKNTFGERRNSGLRYS